jgi:hypothetical protein
VPQHANGISQVTARTRTRHGTRLEAADGTSVTCTEVPGVLGEVRAIEPLRHGLGNAAKDRSAAAGVNRVTGLVTLIAEWARATAAAPG